jgi:tetratricopeptide (TPR) repeat protein
LLRIGQVARAWLAYIGAVVVVPAVVVAVLEIGLRVGGYGYPTSFLLANAVAGESVHTNNPQFGYRFFPRTMARGSLPLRVAAKAPGAYRIFVLGDSAALGDPEPSVGFSRILEAMLRHEAPDRRFEVVNTAMTAINSHVVRVIAEECARREPDLFLVYVGNNEVVGPFGPGTVFTAVARRPWLIRASIALKGTRTGQLLDIAGRRSAPAEWGGMEMFLANVIGAEDERLESVYRHLGGNLEAIVDAGRKAGARVVLTTVPSNLRECAPFAARGGADAEYRKAGALYESGSHQEAARGFTRARDLDGLRFRADSRMNAAIRETARVAGAELLDAEQVFAGASAHGVPGEDLFYEHVHMNFHGNYVLARAVFDRVMGKAPGLSEPECAERLAFTGWNQYKVYSEVAARIARAPFTNQLDHARRAAAVERWLGELRRSAPQQALAMYERAVAANPSDWMLRENFAAFLEAHGNPRAAAGQLRVVLGMLPWYAGAHSVLGLAVAETGEFAEATSQCEEAIRLEPFTAEWRYNLGNVLAQRGDVDAAIARYREALARQPRFADAHYNLGIALARASRHEEAAAEFRATQRLRPADVNALNNLGVMLVQTGRLEEAADQYREILRIAPAYAIAHRNLAGILAKLGREKEAREHQARAIEIERGAGSAP